MAVTTRNGWEGGRGGAPPWEIGAQTKRAPAGDKGLTRFLAWFSLGLGAAQLIAPAAVARLIGVRADRDTRRLMRFLGLRELASGIAILAGRPAGGLWARVAGDAMDLGLLGAALAGKPPQPQRTLGALGAVAGVAALDVAGGALHSRQTGNQHGQKARSGMDVTKTITINRTPDEVYQFWHQFENLPSFMSHLESVTVLDGARSHWKARAPLGASIEWDAEITEDRPGQSIAWRSLEGASVENAGVVSFAAAPGGRGTEVMVRLTYSPPGGALGAAIAKLFGEEPSQQISGDLRRLKQVLETGEVVHSDASIHRGPHSARPPEHRLQPGEREIGR